MSEALAKAWEQGAEAAWSRSTPTVNGQNYKWRSSGEPKNPHVGEPVSSTFHDALNSAAFTVESRHHFHNATQCLCGFESPRARSRTEHITQVLISEFRRFTGGTP